MTQPLYRTWIYRRDGKVQGPFPESLICRFMVVGRVRPQDEVSLDGSYWRKAEEVPELEEGVRSLLSAKNVTDDPEWAEERIKATLRWLDDRKSPDPRARNAGYQMPHENIRPRSGEDRRQNPETVEQHAYREGRNEYESWLKRQGQRYGLVIALASLVVVLIFLFTLFYRPVNPIKIDFRVQASACQATAKAGVTWSGCNKNDMLLVGADLYGAELVGTSLQRTNLSYADLRHANLSQADLGGANLVGARLGDAVWTDGRLCASDSVGACK
jgi:hypothetical protein